MKKGQIINRDDLDYKRPGGALNPEMTEFLIGRTIKKDLKYDHILTLDDII